MRRSALLFASLALVATAAFSGDGNVHRNARHIPGRYIVVLAPGADGATVATSVHGRVHHEYKHGFNSLSLESTEADPHPLARNSRVQFVEEDRTLSFASTPRRLGRLAQRHR